ncbi:MAG: hypothetical protein AAF108_02640 [Planctomycetota bacterium]
MSAAGDPGEALAALLEGGAPPSDAAELPELATADGEAMCEPIVMELVRSFLMWEAGATAASSAISALCGEVVDLNELRVCFEQELVEVVGIDDEFAVERVSRCVTALNWVFVEHHSVSLASVGAMGKLEARAYLRAIDGVPPYVASRVALVGLGAHAVPVDGRLLSVLASDGLVPDGLDEEQASSWLERQIRAGDGRAAFAAFEALAAGGVKKASRKKVGAKRG